MSDAVLIAIVAGITTAVPIIVTQIAGIIISIRSQARVELKADSADKKLNSIHEQTNSNLTEQKAQIKSLNDQIQVLIQEKGEAKGKAESSDKGN